MSCPLHKPKRTALSVYKLILIACAAALALKFFVIDIVIVRGDSMDPTIQSNSLAFVLPCAYGFKMPGSASYLIPWKKPALGDIVIVTPSGKTPRRAIKRIFEVGPAWLHVEGNTLRAGNGCVPLDETSQYIRNSAVYIAAGRLFVVGDNAEHSLDSRDYGSIPIEKLEAKVLFYFHVF